MVSPLRRKLWRDIRRHRAQFAAITITVFLGVTIFGATYDSYQNLRASYDTTATEFAFANLTIAGGDVTAIAGDVASIDGIQATQLRSVADIPFQVGDVKLLGRAVGMPATGRAAVNQIDVIEFADSRRSVGIEPGYCYLFEHCHL